MQHCQSRVAQFLSKIEAQQHLNAFVEVYAEEALARAAHIDQKIAVGTAGRLAGLVVGLKDVISHENHRLSAGSHILGNFTAQYNATVVTRLLAEDAIIIGKQNCDEFGMGSSNENSAFGPVRQAIDPTRVPGGSSGGSAVAVQAGLCDVSIGSDTGGSVRQPAAFCGVYGLKPTYSRISRHGLVAYASSFDCVGILANQVQHLAQVLEVIAGADSYDGTVSERPVPTYAQNLHFDKPTRIACLRPTLENDALEPAIRQAIQAKINWLTEQGHTVEEVDFPLLDYILPTYYLLTTAEASANLARYDGVRYGFRSQTYHDLAELYKNTRSEGFGKEVQRRILLGTFVLGAGYYEAYFTKAQKVRNLIQSLTKEILSAYEFILLPTTPTTAFRLGEPQKDALQMYWADIFTVQANLVGIPAISIPIGLDPNQLPIGLQVMGNFFQEERLLAFAQYLAS